MLYGDIDQRRDRRTGAYHRYRRKVLRDAGIHDVDVLYDRGRLVNQRQAIATHDARRVVELESPPVVTRNAVVAEAVAVQVHSSLVLWRTVCFSIQTDRQ